MSLHFSTVQVAVAPHAVPADVGVYSLTVSNDLGVVTSDPAELLLTTAPVTPGAPSTRTAPRIRANPRRQARVAVDRSERAGIEAIKGFKTLNEASGGDEISPSLEEKIDQ